MPLKLKIKLEWPIIICATRCGWVQLQNLLMQIKCFGIFYKIIAIKTSKSRLNWYWKNTILFCRIKALKLWHKLDKFKIKFEICGKMFLKFSHSLHMLFLFFWILNKITLKRRKTFDRNFILCEKKNLFTNLWIKFLGSSGCCQNDSYVTTALAYCKKSWAKSGISTILYRVTRLGKFAPILLLFQAHCNSLKSWNSPNKCQHFGHFCLSILKNSLE